MKVLNEKEVSVVIAKVLMFIIIMFLPFLLSSEAEKEIEDIDLVSLADLLETKITVASKRSVTQREAPGIVTVITESDIKRNHCRSLVDVINMVPGLNVAMDDDYQAAIISRGLYGFEGRTLIMIDGMQLTELYFGAFSLDDELPIHLIKKIEIIRGPGSVLYGGNAELAVINIITKKGEASEGGEAAVRYGHLKNLFGHRDISVSIGRKLKDFEFSFLGSFSQANRANDRFKLIDRDYSFKHAKDNVGTESTTMLFLAKFLKNSELKLLYNNYALDNVRRWRTEDYPSIDEGYNANNYVSEFRTIGFDISNKLILTPSLKVISAVNYQYSYPFQWTEGMTRQGVIIKRLKPSVYGLYTQNNLELIVGGEYFWDSASVDTPVGVEFTDGLRKHLDDELQEKVTIRNYALYFNVRYSPVFQSTKLTFDTGFRYDNNDLYGNKMNPRFCFILQSHRMHTKVLLSSAFRAPNIANNVWSRYGMDPNKPWRQKVTPESTMVAEFELGYHFSNFLFSVNTFYQIVKDIIEFRYNIANDDLFSDNGGKIGTYGIESEVKCITKKYQGMLNFSLAFPKFFHDINPDAYAYNDAVGGDTYVTPDSDENGYSLRRELLGVPKIKLYTSHSVSFANHLSIQFMALYLSSRWAYDGGGISRKIPSRLILNIGFLYDNLFVKGLDLAFSIHDIANQQQELVVPWYDNGVDSRGHRGREFSLSFRYKFEI